MTELNLTHMEHINGGGPITEGILALCATTFYLNPAWTTFCAGVGFGEVVGRLVNWLID